MHYEDDDPPIKSHPASKEYRDNYDTIDWGERRATPRGEECADCGAKPPAQCDDRIHCTIRSYANLTKPVAHGVIEGAEPPRYSCETCCDTGRINDPTAPSCAWLEGAEGLVNCYECSIRGKQLP